MSDTDTSTALAAGAAAATAERAAEDVSQLAQDTEQALEDQQRELQWQEDMRRMMSESLSELRAVIEAQGAILDEVIARLDLLESEYEAPEDDPGEEQDDVTTLEGSAGGSESPEDQTATDGQDPEPIPQGKHKKRAMGLW